jgi:hypothetical protein
VTAGAIATAVTTVGVVIAASLGVPTLESGSLLTVFLAADTPLAWSFHLLTGIALAIAYATLFSPHLPGSATLRGATFGALLWALAQGYWLIQPQTAPLADVARWAIGSLPTHLLYGALVGWWCGVHPRRHPTSTRAHA